jgi:hypothetical protein
MSPRHPLFSRIRLILLVLILAMLSLACILPQMIIGEKDARPTQRIPIPTDTKQPIPTRPAVPTATQTPPETDEFKDPQPDATAASADEEENSIPEFGGTYDVFEGELNGVSYSLHFPANFLPASANGVDRLCDENDENLCVTIRRPIGSWEDAQGMADALMAELRSEVTQLNIQHQQHTTTADGFPAYWVGCTYTRDGVAYQSSRLFVMVQNVSFEIAGYGEPEKMETYAPLIKMMIESFTIVYN